LTIKAKTMSKRDAPLSNVFKFLNDETSDWEMDFLTLVGSERFIVF
jgi:hypothetical protein